MTEELQNEQPGVMERPPSPPGLAAGFPVPFLEPPPRARWAVVITLTCPCSGDETPLVPAPGGLEISVTLPSVLCYSSPGIRG